MKSSLRVGAIQELALLLVIIAFLWHVAAPLAAPDVIVGRGGRYLALWLEFAEGSLQTRVLPVALVAKAGMVLAILALTGWLVLMVGRVALPVGGILALGLSIWAGGIALLPVPLLDGGHRTLAFSISLGALLASPLAARATNGYWQTAQKPGRFWLYPMFVLLTGLGILWLIDYSARAALDLRNLASYQLVSLLQASFLLTVGASIQPSLMRILARLLARIDGLALPVTEQGLQHSRLKNLIHSLLPRLGLLLLFALGCAAVLAIIGLDRNRSALRAELIRLLVCTVGGWLTYRWLDTGAIKTSTLRGWISTGILCVLTILPLVRGDDSGQILLLAFAVTCVMGAMVGASIFRPGGASMVLGLALTLVLWASLLWVLYKFGPDYSLTVARRIAALKEGFQSYYEYLSELRWLLANTPSGGYGLGHAPWCGTLQSMGDLDTCSAMAHQAQSDYVMGILSANFGRIAAWSLAAAVAAWLLGLLQARTLPATSAAQAEKLAQWIVTIFVALSLVQLFLTCLASIGLMPLTGVNFPLLSYGKASLLVTASLAALGMNRPVST